MPRPSSPRDRFISQLSPELRSRVILPDEDPRAFRSVLAEQAGRAPAERLPELRATEARMQVRDVDGLKVAFRAVVFDEPSVDMGGWREVIKRGAFRKLLATKPDVRFLHHNHEGMPLARTTNGSLVLEEKPEGLDGVASLSNTQASRDLLVSIERGDLTQMSFLFVAGDATWEYHEGDDYETRYVATVDWLGEVCPVTFPAYESTTVGVSRSHQDADPQEGEPGRAPEGSPSAAEQRGTDQGEHTDVAGAAPEWDAAAKRRRLQLRERVARV